MAAMDSETTMDVVLKNIYSSCDPDETNQVPSAKLIEFISPYLIQDVIAFESLKMDLDPENKNVPISSEKFFEIMNKWAKKIANSNDDVDDGFNCTPSQLDEIDDKDLPFIQSTPRASFGQKLLSCEELLNLSNLTATDLAATANINNDSTVGQTRQFLEEEVKRLEHQLKQALAEMDMMKGQITATEEQNEHLQTELNRCRTRLANEQQMISHLQKDKVNTDELKEEISAKKRDLENLNKKVHQYEKDTSYMSMMIQQLESENTKLTERCEDLNSREQKLKRDVFDIKTELEVKEQELSIISRHNEELKQKLNEEKQIIEDLTQEKDFLDYKKNTLERRLSSRRYSSFSPCQSNTRNLSIQDHSYDEDSSFELSTTEAAKSSNQQVSLHAELFQTGQFEPNHKEDTNDDDADGWNSDELINSLTLENETLKEQITILNDENETLQTQINEANTKLEDFSKEMRKMQTDKEENDKKIKNLENEKQDLENRMKNMEVRYPELLNKNQDKIQELEDTLSKVRKDYSNLQTQCKSQENELAQFRNKFNFEIPFKNLQMELNQKNKELDELNHSCQNYKSLVQKLTTTNLDLTKSLNKTKQALEEYTIRKKEIMDKRNEGNHQVQTQLDSKNQCINELMATNKSYGEKISHLEVELHEKLSEIKRLKDMQMKNMGIRNTMWKNYKDLKDTTDSLKNKLEDSEKSIKELKDEHNKLLAVYNDEVTKNNELCEQINKQKEELYEAVSKYQETNENNRRLLEQIDGLKKESVEIKENQRASNRKISEKLCEYTEMIKKYDEKLKQVENLNESLKLELQVEKNDVEKITEYQAVLEIKENTISELEVANQSLKAELEQQKAIAENSVRFEALIEAKDRAIKDLEACNGTLKADLEQTSEQCSKKIIEFDAIFKKKEDAIRELEVAFQHERNQNVVKISEYEKIIEEKEKIIKELELENSNLKYALAQEKRLADEKKENDDSLVDSLSSWFAPEKLSSKSKNRSFDKQKLIIDKLRLKIGNLEVELQRERSKNLTLSAQKDEINGQLQQLKENYANLQRDSLLEKETCANKITELLKKNETQEEHLKIINSSSEEKILNLSRTLSHIEDIHRKSKLELESKDNLLKQQLEMIENNMLASHKLNKTIQELNTEISKKEIELKNCTVENENLKNLCDHSEKKLQELSLKVFELEREINNRRDEVGLLSNCVQEKDETIQELKSKVTEFDDKFSEIFLELTEKENQYALLLEEKENLQDRLSKTDDRKEMELMDLEEKVKNARAMLQSLNAEIGMTKRLLNDSLEGYSSSNRKKILVDADVVANSNRELFRTLSLALKNWQVALQNDARFRCILPLEGENSPELDESMFSLSEKIIIAVMLLEILATKAPMENCGGASEFSGFSTEIQNRTLKKFTLRPSKLVVGRPVSPDSPSIGNEGECGDILKSSKVRDSPDSRTIETDNDINDISDDVFENTTANASQLFSPLGLLFDDAFPHLTDNFLEKIGLHEDGSKQVLSVPETERVFATFAIQIALDSADINERLEKQREACEKQHRRLLHFMKDISVRLREHKCIGAMDSIKPVFVLLEDVRYLLREIMQTSGQYGILSCEHRMMKCWNMVTNYMAILKREANISPSKRKQTIFDKEVCTNNLQEGLKNFVESIESRQKRLDEEGLGQNDPDFTDDVVGHSCRCNAFLSQFKRLTKWVVFLIFFAFLGLVSIHWQCQLSTTENHMCPLDAFIKKINVGTPPY